MQKVKLKRCSICGRVIKRAAVVDKQGSTSKHKLLAHPDCLEAQQAQCDDLYDSVRDNWE